MMDEQPQEERIFSPLAERMRSDYFTVAENFKEAWTLMKSRFSYYVFLALLVYLPIQIVLQYQVSLLDLTVEAPELLMAQMAKLGIVQLVMTLLEEVAILVIAVICALWIDETQMETKTFSAIFYRGIRMWPRAIVTLILVALGAVVCISAMSILVIMPLMGLLVIPGVLLVAILLVMLQSCTGTTAALRARMGFDNIRYVFFVLKGRMWQTLGIFALITVLTGVLQMGLSLALSNIFDFITQPVVSMALQVVISTMTSIITMYGYTVGALVFMGAEYRKEKLLTENQ